MRIVAANSSPKFSFNTVNASSAPHTLAGTPSMHARVDGNATEITTGITLTADFDSKTGENQVAIDLSASASYTAGSIVEVFVAAGTVNSVSVVGLKVFEFLIGTTGSIDAAITRLLLALPAAASNANGGLPILSSSGTTLGYTMTNLTNAPTSGDLTPTMKASVNTEADTALTDYGALKPTVAGRTFDVNAAGEGGLDWGNVGNKTTTNDLSGTTIAASQVVASVAGNVGGNVVGNVGGSTGSISGVTFPTNFGSLGINVSGHLSRVTLVDDVTAKTGYSLANGSIVTATFGTCDFTTTMKTSIGTAVAASAVASVIGDVGGDVAGKVRGEGAGTISGAGAWVLDGTGTAVGTAANQTTILTRIGAFAGSGVNTILGFLRAIMRSDASDPSDVGGTYAAASHSNQASRQRLDTWHEADHVIDTGTTPWAEVVKVKGTSTELVRRKLRDTAGTNITDTETVIGSAKES